jgi:hypothetical protein
VPAAQFADRLMPTFDMQGWIDLLPAGRIVHHATILEMNVESYRRKTALARKRAPARQATARATISDKP